MTRRWLVVPVLALVLLAVTAAPAPAALGTLWSQPLAGTPQLVGDGNGAFVIWASDDAGGTALVAQRYDRAGDPRFAEPVTLVPAVSGLTEWRAASDGTWGVIVAWQASGTTCVQHFGLEGTAIYDPVVVCSDAQVEVARGAGASAALAGIEATRDGGVYVRSVVSPSSTDGDTLLDYVSPAGALAAPDPGSAVPDGTVGAMAADVADHLYVLLQAPGRGNVAMQRYSPHLKADWAKPVVPGNPFAVGGADTQVAVDVVADVNAVAVWRQGTVVKVSLLSPAGRWLWLDTPHFDIPGTVWAADDGYSGCYLASVSGAAIRVRHLLASGDLVGGADGIAVVGGLGQPHIGAVAANTSGDLSVSFVDDAAYTSGFGVARCDYVGQKSVVPLAPAQPTPAALASDGRGGVYALAGGPAGSELWRVCETGIGVTMRPRATVVTYGKYVTLTGFLIDAGEGVGEQHILLRGKPAGGGATRLGAEPVTSPTGYYSASVKPWANASWSAEVRALPGGTVVSTPVVIQVRPQVTLAIGHGGTQSHPAEILSGVVRPADPGLRLLVQRRQGQSWHTFATAKLDGTSHYRFSWKPPLHTATYVLRVLAPAHGDHISGASPTVTLRVKVTKP